MRQRVRGERAMASASEASELLRSTLIEDFEYTGYTHDIAAQVLQDTGLDVWLYIIADEPGTGECICCWNYQTAHHVLNNLAEMGGEEIILRPDINGGRCGIEFRHSPDLDKQLQSIAKLAQGIVDANKH